MGIWTTRADLHRYVEHLDTAQPPWLPESEFAVLDADMHAWRRMLPECLEFSPENICIRRESSQLGALVALHCLYHNTLCDLYRIAMPELLRIRKPFPFSPEQRPFVEDLGSRCFDHAKRVAALLADVAWHGAQYLADSLLPTITYNSSRIMLYYLARMLDPTRWRANKVITDTVRYISRNNQVLPAMMPMFPLAEPLVRPLPCVSVCG